MHVYLEEIKFKVEDFRWIDKQDFYIDGYLKVGISQEVGKVMEETVQLYEERTFDLNKLPQEIQEKLVDVYKDIQNHLDKFTVPNKIMK